MIMRGQSESYSDVIIRVARGRERDEIPELLPETEIA
jgi:hypothetical protein